MTPLREAVGDAFGPEGALARADVRYVERDVQLRMAAAVAVAIDERRALVAEAGTGVGKTFAYLVPTLLSGARALISTATKSPENIRTSVGSARSHSACVTGRSRKYERPRSPRSRRA